mgnify:CR=1 FL=1
MTFPIDIAIGPIQLNLHFLMETLGFIIGFRFFLRLRKKQSDHISEPNRIWIIIGAAAGALLFSRLLGALEHPKNLLSTDHVLLYLYTNKTIVGGLLGGLMGVELTKKLIGETKSSGDLFTYPLVLAMMIGRIGCFSMGIHEETYGIETSWPTGMNLGDGLLRHPVSLYEIAALWLFWIAMLQIERRIVLKEGLRFQFFMIYYLLFRFILDFIKPGYTYFWGIGSIQLTCIIGLLYYSPTLIKLFFQRKKLLLSG